MDNKNTIAEALSQVPDLTATAKTAIEQNERILAAFSRLMEKHVQAEIPADEVTNKVITPLSSVIRRTPCAAPDASKVSDLIAKGVLEMIRSEVKASVREAVKDTPITLEHHHTHMTALGLTKMAEEKTRRLLTLACVTLGALLLWIGAALFIYFRSDTYWGEQYYEVMTSQYTTKAERDMLWENISLQSVLPKEFKTNSAHVKDKIRQNKKVLRQRRRKGKDKNGNYSTQIPLER